MTYLANIEIQIHADSAGPCWPEAESGKSNMADGGQKWAKTLGQHHSRIFEYSVRGFYLKRYLWGPYLRKMWFQSLTEMAKVEKCNILTNSFPLEAIINMLT